MLHGSSKKLICKGVRTLHSNPHLCVLDLMRKKPLRKLMRNLASSQQLPKVKSRRHSPPLNSEDVRPPEIISTHWIKLLPPLKRATSTIVNPTAFLFLRTCSLPTE